MGYWTDTIATALSAANLNRFRADSVELDDAGATTNSLRITPTTNKGSSTSTGGAGLINNTGSTGAGLVVFSNRGSDAAGRLLVVRQTHAANPQQTVYFECAGTNHGVVISHGGTGTASLALSVTSTNEDDTTAGFTGSQTSRATLKVRHIKPTGADTNAAAVTISIEGPGTACQGVFLDAPDGTTGKLLNLRVGGVEMLTLSPTGDLAVAGDITAAGTAVVLDTDARLEREYVFSISGDVAVAAGTHRLYLENGGIITSVRASVGTAPTGASLLVDINRNGTTIYGTQANRPTIAASGNTATGGAASNGSFTAGDYVTIDVDQVGSTVAGADLVVQIKVAE